METLAPIPPQEPSFPQNLSQLEQQRLVQADRNWRDVEARLQIAQGAGAFFDRWQAEGDAQLKGKMEEARANLAAKGTTEERITTQLQKLVKEHDKITSEQRGALVRILPSLQGNAKVAEALLHRVNPGYAEQLTRWARKDAPPAAETPAAPPPTETTSQPQTEEPGLDYTRPEFQPYTLDNLKNQNFVALPGGSEKEQALFASRAADAIFALADEAHLPQEQLAVVFDRMVNLATQIQRENLQPQRTYHQERIGTPREELRRNLVQALSRQANIRETNDPEVNRMVNLLMGFTQDNKLMDSLGSDLSAEDLANQGVDNPQAEVESRIARRAGDLGKGLAGLYQALTEKIEVPPQAPPPTEDASADSGWPGGRPDDAMEGEDAEFYHQRREWQEYEQARQISQEPEGGPAQRQYIQQRENEMQDTIQRMRDNGESETAIASYEAGIRQSIKNAIDFARRPEEAERIAGRTQELVDKLRSLNPDLAAQILSKAAEPTPAFEPGGVEPKETAEDDFAQFDTLKGYWEVWQTQKELGLGMENGEYYQKWLMDRAIQLQEDLKDVPPEEQEAYKQDFDRETDHLLKRSRLPGRLHEAQDMVDNLAEQLKALNPQLAEQLLSTAEAEITSSPEPAQSPASEPVVDPTISAAAEPEVLDQAPATDEIQLVEPEAVLGEPPAEPAPAPEPQADQPPTPEPAAEAESPEQAQARAEAEAFVQQMKEEFRQNAQAAGRTVSEDELTQMVTSYLESGEEPQF